MDETEAGTYINESSCYNEIALTEIRNKKFVPIWEKYMLTVDEAVQYFGIGEKRMRALMAENINSDFCFTVQIGNKSLINRQKFEDFLNRTTSL